jgi:hypothetical protein
LVVIVIIAILFSLYGGGPSAGGGAAGTGGTVLGGAIDRARGVTCRNNLQQIRAAISTYSGMNDGSFPPSLDTLQLGVPLQCPEGGEPYQYDPTTGQVHCLHPGHQSF